MSRPEKDLTESEFPFSSQGIQRHVANCIECGLCVRECRFLQEYGTPKAIASSWGPDSKAGQRLPFACNLCGLCTAVCPPKVGLDPRAMFLEMRQQVAANGVASFPEHKRLLAYEKRGTSSLFSCFALPKNCDERCDTVLFPGCAFAGTRPTRLLELLAHLRQSIPTLGMVLGCCTKPSHDLGRSDFFHSRFGQLRQALTAQGVRRVLVICPSCHAVFKQYGSPLHTEYVYTLLGELPLPDRYIQYRKALGCQPVMSPVKTTGYVRSPLTGLGKDSVPAGRTRIAQSFKAGLEKVTVHDPCPTRQDPQVHAAVRKLLAATGFKVKEMPHHGKKTLCCGEGGAVPFTRKDLALHWGNLRQQEMQYTAPLAITYCAGCVDFLRSRMQIVHLLDLLFAPEATLAGRVKIARAPFTYLNRLLLKRSLKKLLSGAENNSTR